MKEKLLFLVTALSNIVIYGAYYVNPSSGNDNTGTGTSGKPFKTITKAITEANNDNVSEVYVVGGTYDINSVNITTNCSNLITVSPAPGQKVTLRNTNFRFIRFYNGANNIKFTGFEIDGKSNTTDHWTILSQYVWLPGTFTEALKGGGIAFNIEDATNVTIENNTIHDFYQKAVNIESGRYVLITGNIIYNIALTSLSGGHGIMRQQGTGSFSDADDPAKYRWDINGNLIFNVSQRIYSWVPSKGYLNMTLDEGKPILIDETPNHDQNMKARITQNIVAYNTIDAIRLKPTVNLEVTNNTVFAFDNHADGITDTMAGVTFSDPFKGSSITNNLVAVASDRFAFELGDVATSTGITTNNNYYISGQATPSSYASSTTNTFVDALNGKFQLTSGPQSYGVSSSIITNLQNKATNEGIVVQKAPWETNHLKNVQTLLDAIPGVEDGINGNETVFTDAGTYARSDEEWTLNRKAYYFSVNTTWKNDNVANNKLDQRTELDAYDGMYEIIVPFEYSTWFENAQNTYGTNKRIRYGESVIAQNKVLPANSLYITEINSATDYQITTALNNSVTLDGDLVVKFNFVPNGNETFDFLVANSITATNTNGLFDNVNIMGYTGTYTLNVVTDGGLNKLRLTLTSPPLSTIDTKKEQIAIYPNPAGKDGFYIKNSSAIKNFSVKVYNSLGQEIAFDYSLSGNNSILCKPNKTITPGIYHVKILIGNTEKLMKLLVK